MLGRIVAVNPADYDRIVDGEPRDPYRVVVAVPEAVELEARLTQGGYSFEQGDDGFFVGRCHVSSEEGGFSRPYGRDLSSVDIEALKGAAQQIGLETTLGAEWRSDVRAVMVLADRIAPELLGLYDSGAYSYYSGRWVRAVAAGRPIT